MRKSLILALLFLGPLTINIQRSTLDVRHSTSNAAAPLVLSGWLPSWDWANASATLREQVDMLDEISPFWYQMQPEGSLSAYVDDQIIAEVLAVARDANRPVIPTINNNSDKERVRAMITDPQRRAAHVSAIVAEVIRRGYAGIDIDYEALYPDDRAAFTAFIAELAAALHTQGRVLTVAVFPKTREPGEYINSQVYDYAALGAVADELRIMAYNWSYRGGAPGPIAPYWWVENVTRFAVTQVDPARIMVGVPLYGYDWPASTSAGPDDGVPAGPDLSDLGVPDALATPQPARSVTWLDVYGLTRTYQPTVLWTESSSRGPVREHSLTYSDTISTRTVWFADHDSVAARRELAARLGVKGIALWRLGSEDPAVWAALDGRACRADVDRDDEYDIRDVMLVARAWGAVAGEDGYDPHADLSADGQVDAIDVQQVAAGWLNGCE